ncbi:hypothetical protein FA95DRAFT_1229427 [Auriscalpium vulgare]|uniref:Uncharacterized protein n=1 Tax=Auriscalpium vulgare TaxID=40419 RepID=A0ACB8R386_9AGAM|nr:hypothetical protein FA95DRAFT_1229427 [Auriscalpium vulgare]
MTAHVDVPQRTVARLATPPSTPGRHMPSASSSAHGLLNSGRTTSQVPQSQVPQSQVPRSQVQQSQPTAKAAPSTGWKREPRTPTSSSSSNEPSPPSTPQRRQATAPPGNLTPSTPRRRGATPVADNYSSPQLHPDAKAIAVANAYAWWVVVIGKEPGVYHGIVRELRWETCVASVSCRQARRATPMSSSPRTTCSGVSTRVSRSLYELLRSSFLVAEASVSAVPTVSS